MNILIVEDEEEILDEIYRTVLEYDPSWRCAQFINPAEALAYAEKEHVDMALLDIQMPGMNGMELARRLLNRHREINLIFITAYNHFAVEAFDLDALDYILKPIRKERLFKALNKLEKRVKRSEPPVTESVHIQSFKKFRVTVRGGLLRWKRNKSFELLAYLLHRKDAPVHKEVLCEMLWPDHDPQKALVNLQTVMYGLRKELAEYCPDRVQIGYANHAYQLTLHNCTYDVETFCSICDESSKGDGELDKLVEAELLYEGSYLEEDGWYWAVQEQRYLELRYEKLLERIIEICIDRGIPQTGLKYMCKWVAVAGLDEQHAFIRWVKEQLGGNAIRQLVEIGRTAEL